MELYFVKPSVNLLTPSFFRPIKLLYDRFFSNRLLAKKVCTLYLNPNPASDIVTIKLKEDINNNQISVLNMMKEQVFTTNINTSNYELDVSNFVNRMYIVNVISKSKYECREKLVIIH